MIEGVGTAAVIGTGVIGAGWATRFLAWGLDVVAYDPGPGAEAKLRAAVARAWPAISQLGLAAGATPERLRFAGSVAEAVAEADFVQESAPERIELKRKLHAEIDAAARPEVPVASSSSGLLPSEIQADCAHPERLLIGHPFNPVYLLPLVELVAGAKTAPEAIARGRAFYAGVGMHPLVVRKEVPAYLSDRLQEALWREYLHLVNEGVATTDELDQAMAYGPGLRWAFWGTGMIFHLAGGEAGMRHMLQQFGPALKLPWTKLEAPELSETLIDRMVEGTQAQAGDASIEELEQLRDQSLIAVMRALRPFDVGAGRTLADYEARMFAAVQPEVWQPGATVETPLRLAEGFVRPDWVDYNQHMSEAFFVTAIGEASDALFRYIGIDEAYRGAGHSFYTVESHLNYYGEGKLNQRLAYETRVLGLDAKRLRIHHAILDRDSGDTIFTAEQMLLHVDAKIGKTAAILPGPKAALDAIWAVHSRAAPPSDAGKAIAMPAAKGS
ncbi:MAG: carnitine 3-dehydrogenase [Rhodospirillales bacterium]